MTAKFLFVSPNLCLSFKRALQNHWNKLCLLWSVLHGIVIFSLVNNLDTATEQTDILCVKWNTEIGRRNFEKLTLITSIICVS